MKKAVLLITFNRLNPVIETLKSISEAKPPRLYIFSDGPRPNKVGEDKQISTVRQYVLDHIHWPCEVYTKFLDKNSGGCRNGVPTAITWFFKHEEDGIIIEDDCVPCQSFYRYCEECLDKYRDNQNIWTICGDAPTDTDYPETYYFGRINWPWGWATWANRWKYFSLDVSMYDKKICKVISNNKYVQDWWFNLLKAHQKQPINTWDQEWIFHIIAHNGLCIIPSRNMVKNVGEDGEHFSKTDSHLSDDPAHILYRNTFDFKTIIHPKKVVVKNEMLDNYLDRFEIKIPSTIEHKVYFLGCPLFSVIKEEIQ